MYTEYSELGYILFLIINYIDLCMTKVILDNGGTEWNFIARGFYKKLGINGIIVLKVIVLSGLGIQLVRNQLDTYSIFYLCFMFTVVLIFMYKDACEAGLKNKINIFKIN